MNIIATVAPTERRHAGQPQDARMRWTPTRSAGRASDAPSTSQHELAILATIAHELRGPLTALAASSEVLAEDFDRLEREQVQRLLGAMHRRTLWLQGLVENLLCAATIRDGRLALYRQSLSIADLVADVKAVVDPLLAQKGQRLRVRLIQPLPEVLADSRRLGQVLVNLILNANKFSPPDTTVDLTVAARNGQVRVSVADHGPGITPDQAHRLFEPYYRAPASASHGKEGVGLGLSIVRSIVAAHGGRVGVDNRRGGGARFWFEIPTAKQHLSVVS